MGFDEVQFPSDISYGSRGGPGFNTAIIEVDSGQEERIARWAEARRRYDVSYGVKSRDKLSTLLTFYMARQGAANGFRYKDWVDFASPSNHRTDPTAVAFGDHHIGDGDASKTQFQLRKKYVNGSVTRIRLIRKPVAGTTKIGFDSVEQTSGWSVNTTTGIVTFTSAPGAGVVISAGFEFDVPVRFGEAVDEVLSISLDAFDTRSLQSIPLIEILDDVANPDEYYYGGGSAITMNADYTLSLLDGRSILLTAPSSGKSLILPAYAGLSAGGPYFFIKNLGANSIAIKDITTLLTTLASGGATSLVLWLSDEPKWYVSL